MSRSVIADIVSRADGLLRSGHASGVPYLLQGLNLAKLARDERLPLAQICRRAGLFTLGLRLLTPVITGRDARDLEKAEYATLLMKIGSIAEAAELLSRVRDPRALLYLGFCHLNRWDFAAAVPVLESYLASKPAPYDALVARVNLASALIPLERYVDAEPIVAESLENARTERLGRLLANLLEMRAQIAIAREDWGEAERDLAFALDLIGRQQTNDQLYLLKWQAVIAARRDGDLAALDLFRAQAVARGEFESVREADYQRLRLEYDDALARRLHFGTPWSWFRERLAREVPRFQAAATHRVGEGEVLALEGGLVDTLIKTLALDFYAPWALGALFARLYPGEHYHFLHSPNRVHQLLHRARRRLEGTAVEIEEVRGRFRLVVGPGGAIVVGAPEADRLQRLRALHGHSFTALEAQSTLGLSEPTVRRLLNEALEARELERTRVGRAVRYRFVA